VDGAGVKRAASKKKKRNTRRRSTTQFYDFSRIFPVGVGASLYVFACLILVFYFAVRMRVCGEENREKKRKKKIL
jgi:hypothetical protein